MECLQRLDGIFINEIGCYYFENDMRLKNSNRSIPCAHVRGNYRKSACLSRSFGGKNGGKYG